MSDISDTREPQPNVSAADMAAEPDPPPVLEMADQPAEGSTPQSMKPGTDADANVSQEAASTVLAWSEERFSPDMLGDIRQEHMHRYLWCADIVAGKAVLDVASGEGYGSAILAETAASVMGVDISVDAVRHADAVYGSMDNVSFQASDAATIPADDDTFDVVVSFETIEHIEKQSEALAEWRRVLRPDGFVVISTPDKEVYSQRQQHDNHFHVRELSKGEFGALLGEYFPAQRMLGQRLSVVSSLFGEEPHDALEVAKVVQDGETVTLGTQPLQANMYLIALAAAEHAMLPQPNPSVLFNSQTDLYWRWKDRERELSKALAIANQGMKQLYGAMDECQIVLASGLFDHWHYTTQANIKNASAEMAVLHYLQEGERIGHSPSPNFTPSRYLDCNPDLKDVPNLFLHYVKYGRFEGRSL